ncbi:type II toxin-antitoxin system HipA family toxin [soil metagenome]
MAYVPATLIEVRAWGQTVGAIAPAARGRAYEFEYDPGWVRSGLQLAPALMPLAARTRYAFPSLPIETFFGLPPMLADALPDSFGNAIVNASLAREGIPASDITALDRLAYLGARGLGALEFLPDTAPHQPPPTALDLADLINSARAAVRGSLATDAESEESLRRIIDVGTSAGGARAKAIVNWNPDTDELRSGHLPPVDGFQPWLLKFDGVGDDQQLGRSGNYGRIEYAYSLMAAAAGIRMSDTRLLHENGRAHFMTRRFDRADDGSKIHLQTLCALDGLDFRLTATHDYAQLFNRIDELALGPDALEQAWRRMAFNVAAANCDDHTKNFSFLFDPDAGWRISPAYDVTHAYSPTSKWTNQHLMSVDGEFGDIRRLHLMAVADRYQVAGASRILEEIAGVTDSWPEFAAQAELPSAAIDEVGRDLRPGALLQKN